MQPALPTIEAASPRPVSAAESQSPNSTQAHKRPRAKRGKYISKACIGCKRRKSKCNGQHPCEHCVYHSLHCQYPPSPARGLSAPSSNDSAGLSQVIESLKNEVASLQGDLNQLRQQQDRQTLPVSSQNNDGTRQQQSETVDQRVPRLEAQDRARGQNNFVEGYTGPPTSLSFESSPGDETRQPAVNYTFNLSLARRHLQEQSAGIEAMDTSDISNASRPTSPPPPNFQETSSSDVDPLWLLDKQEALRLVHAYDEEIGTSYPFLILDELVDRTHRLYDAMEIGSINGFPMSTVPGPAVIETNDLNILRMAISNALTIQTGGSSDLARALFVKAREAALRKLWEPTSVKCIALYTLLAIYEFLSGDDLQAWRIIGIPARWCLELGLHQSSTFKGSTDGSMDDRKLRRIFWCIYTLDRRWAFGVGMPFVFQSSDIDANLPMPDDEVPYLQAMVLLGRINARVWLTLSNSNTSGASADHPKDDLDFLHYRVDRWYDELPEDLKLPREIGSPASQTVSRSLYRLRLLLYLRARQTKILLYQRVLHTPALFNSNTSQVRTVVEIAKDIVQKLDHVNKSTDIYQTQQACLNHFLVSAMGVIFLAVALAPAVYRSLVHDEFHMALNLVRSFSEKSYISKRLWNMIRGLRQAGFTLGLTGNRSSDADNGRGVNAISNTASGGGGTQVPNSGLGGHGYLGVGSINHHDDIPILPPDGNQMTLELNNIFTAMDNGNEFMIPGFLGEGADESMFDGGNPGYDSRALDLAQIWNTLDYIH